MFHELVSAFAGLLLIQGVLFIVGDALGLLGEPVGKIKLIVSWMADMPETLANDVFSHTPKRHFKAHLTSRP